MFVILGGKWAVPVALIESIIPVKVIGTTYRPEGYEVLNELDDDETAIVSGKMLMLEDETKQKVEELATAELPGVKEKLAKAELDLSREKDTTRLSSEMRGVARADIRRWADSCDYSFQLSQANAEKVRAWLKANPKKED